MHPMDPMDPMAMDICEVHGNPVQFQLKSRPPLLRPRELAALSPLGGGSWTRQETQHLTLADPL